MGWLQAALARLRDLFGRSRRDAEALAARKAGVVAADAAPPRVVWCLVANVVKMRRAGPGGVEVRSGTKHFAPGAKVYVIGAYWGMGGETVTVVGRHRKARRFITIATKSKYLTNWRAALVYSPAVLQRIDAGVSGGATLIGHDRAHLEAIAQSFARGAEQRQR